MVPGGPPGHCRAPGEWGVAAGVPQGGRTRGAPRALRCLVGTATRAVPRCGASWQHRRSAELTRGWVRCGTRRHRVQHALGPLRARDLTTQKGEHDASCRH